MKINYITITRFPTEKAYGHQISAMIQEFKKQGCVVDIIAPLFDDSMKIDPKIYYNLEKDIDVKFIKGFAFNRYSCCQRLLFVLHIVLYSFRVLRCIRKNKKDYFYVREPFLAFLLSFFGYNVVYECHDWFRRFIWLKILFLKKSFLIITTNRYIKNNFLKYGFCYEKIVIAPNGVDLSIFDIKMSKNQARKNLIKSGRLNKNILHSKILLYTGSYKTNSQEKGIKYILESLQYLNDDYHFVAVGGTEKDIMFYKRYANNIGVTKKVTFIKIVSKNELAIFQKSSDLLMMPFPNIAHYKYFMAPLKMFEYMASGRVIIASDLPSIREVLTEKNALFCQPGDVDDLVRVIKEYFVSSDEYVSNGLKANLDVYKYSWEKRAEKILDSINSFSHSDIELLSK